MGNLKSAILVVCFAFVCAAAVFGSRNAHKGCRQDGENECLNKDDEKLEPVKGQRQHQEKEGHDEQNHVPRKDVAKETKGERNDFEDFGHQFDESDEHVNQAKGNVAFEQPTETEKARPVSQPL